MEFRVQTVEAGQNVVLVDIGTEWNLELFSVSVYELAVS